MTRVAGLVFLLALAGCNTVSEVVPIGRDSYMVGSNVNTAANRGTTARINAIKAANAFCAKMGKVMTPRRIDSQGMTFGSGASADLIFSCVASDDPEYSRPDLRPDPSVVIQDQRSK